jgi:ClpP class serine protease
MQYSIIKEVFGRPWHIHAMGIEQYRPVVSGMLSGAVIEAEAEPQESLPYAVSANTLQPVAWSHPEEPIEDDDTPEAEPSREKVIHVLPMRGVLIKHDGMCGQPGARTLARRLLNADADASVIGHVLIIEGPGGSASAVPELTEALQQCTKPTVVWVDGMMASAHMYVGAFAKFRIASRATDLVGCIGTMIEFEGRKAESEEDLMKVRAVRVYADDANEKNEEYETAINEFNFKLIKEHILNPHNAQFVADMKAQLPGIEDQHLHGRTFQAAQVIGALVDEIGPFGAAINKVIELSDYKNQAQSPGEQGRAANEYSPIKTEMKQFKNVNAALGVETLEAVDAAVSLNEDQLEALDVALDADPDAELQAQLDAANATIAERDASIATITGQVETANDTIAQRDETIAQLTAENANLKQNPADPGAQIVKPVDGGSSTAGKAITDKYTNPFDALEEVSKEYLGKSI